MLRLVVMPCRLPAHAAPPRCSYLPSSSSAIRPPSYSFRSASMIPRECTLTDRATASVKMNRLGSDSRSEEHTSELQSQSNLVCRLLLEKKKIPTMRTH